MSKLELLRELDCDFVVFPTDTGQILINRPSYITGWNWLLFWKRAASGGWEIGPMLIDYADEKEASVLKIKIAKPKSITQYEWARFWEPRKEAGRQRSIQERLKL